MEKMKILNKKFGKPIWDSGGVAPFQAHLKVEYGNFPYTIYIRERHGSWSCDIFYGWHSLLNDSQVYELTCPNKKSLLQPEDFLNWEERAIVVAEKFFEKNRYRLPRRKRY